MIPPRNTPLQCLDADGNFFVGKRDTFWNVLSPDEARAVREFEDLHQVRWFALGRRGWIECDPPASWAHMPGVNPDWIETEIIKAVSA